MMGEFGYDYFIFVFLSAIGVLQIVAVIKGLNGLSIVRSIKLAVPMWTIFICLSFTWFFGSEPRNLSDTNGGLDGNQTAGLFTLATSTALITSLLASSLLNRNMKGQIRNYSDGIDALRGVTYLQALLKTFRKRNGNNT